MNETRLDSELTRLDSAPGATRLDRSTADGATLPDPAFAPTAEHGGGIYQLPAALRDKFRILRVLPASGAEAEIMILESTQSGVKVAAKLYRPGIVPKFEVLERVRDVAHAHVVRIIAHGVSDGMAYELMEYCAEGSLRDMLRGGPLSRETLRQVVAELAEALAALHECGLIHRDLKPENVLVRRREPLDLVLTDFGITSLLEATQLFTSLARTTKYGAPEALSGVLDAAADWWSLGMILMEALTGEHPFAGFSEPVITHRLATATVDVSALTDPEWRKLCRGLLLRDPKQRWGSAETRRWLAGDASLMEAREEGGGALAAIPYQLESSECRSRAELALALARHWIAGRKDLMRGQLTPWVRDQLKDQNLLRFLLDLLEERDTNEDLRLFRLIAHMAPEQPPVWRGEALAVGQLLALAGHAEQGDEAAGEWLVSVLDSGVLDQVKGAELQELATRWNAADDEAAALWRRADEESKRWRKEHRDPNAPPDFDSLMFGQAESFKRPPAGRLLAMLLLAAADAGYCQQLAQQVVTAAAPHQDRSPWLADLWPDPATTASPAAVVVGHFLLPHAEAAANEDKQRQQRQQKAQEQHLEELASQVNQALDDLRAAADTGFLSGVTERRSLHLAIERFFTLSANLRSLGIDMAHPVIRTVARAESLVFRLRERADEWEHAAQINGIWSNQHVMTIAAIALYLAFRFATHWLLYLLLPPALVILWRFWVIKSIRDAIRELSLSLPTQVGAISKLPQP